MTTTSTSTTRTRTRFHHDAYQFLSAALRHAQRLLGRIARHEDDDEEAHISGGELLDGVRDLARTQFGMMAGTVFRHWGIDCTEDFGRMVFELIDRGEMKKTEQDQLSDFVDVYDFEEEFDRKYRIDTSHAFRC